MRKPPSASRRGGFSFLELELVRLVHHRVIRVLLDQPRQVLLMTARLQVHRQALGLHVDDEVGMEQPQAITVGDPT